jgi:hypothetical protein
MFGRILGTTESGPRDECDKCVVDDDIVSRSCVPRRLMQTFMSTSNDQKSFFQDKIQAAKVAAVCYDDRCVATKEVKHFNHANRLFVLLNQLKCWSGENEYGCQHWDYCDTFGDCEHSLTSDATEVCGFLTSSTDDKGVKKLVTWADDEGLDLLLIHHVRSLIPFPVVRIEI